MIVNTEDSIQDDIDGDEISGDAESPEIGADEAAMPADKSVDVTDTYLGQKTNLLKKEETQVNVGELQSPEVSSPGKMKKASADPDKKVRVKLKEDFTHKVGPQWRRYKSGVTYSVPEHVKEILKRRGVLEVI